MNKNVGLAMVPVGIALNIVGGLLASTLKLPVFLDTIGTILTAAILGPWWGALTGGLSNVLASLQSPMDAWFAIVNILVASSWASRPAASAFRSCRSCSSSERSWPWSPRWSALSSPPTLRRLTGGGIDILVAA